MTHPLFCRVKNASPLDVPVKKRPLGGMEHLTELQPPGTELYKNRSIKEAVILITSTTALSLDKHFVFVY